MPKYKDMSPEERLEYHRKAAIRSEVRNRIYRYAYQKKWKAKNPEKYRAMRKAWRIKNRDKINAQKRASARRCADTIRVRNRKYQQANRDKCRAWNRKHYKKSYAQDPEKWINYGNRRRLQKRGGKLTRGLAKRLLVSQGGKCNICKCDLSQSGYHRDHIKSLSKGGAHEDSNIQLLCPPCNLSKFNKS